MGIQAISSLGWLLVWNLEVNGCTAFSLPVGTQPPPNTRPSLSLSTTNEEGIGVGIDLGTTHSAVSILNEDGIPIILEIDGNGRTMPSVIGLNDSRNDEQHQVLVGREAIDHEVRNPLGTYRNVKRVIGTGERVAQELAQVVPNMVLRSSLSAESTKRRSNNRRKRKKDELGLMKQILDAQENPVSMKLPLINKEEEEESSTTTPEFISSHILQALYRTAEAYTGQNVTRAVIGVPAYFHDEQRDATIRASEIAGVEKVRLLREPEAAALSYGVGMEQAGKGDDDELVLVFDLGGGTYDVSMLVVGGGLTEVISTSGNACLGGSDWDYRIAQYFSKLLLQHIPTSLLADAASGDAMVRAAEAVRIHLSNNLKASLALPLTKEGWTSLEHANDVLLSRNDKRERTGNGIISGSDLLVELSRQTMEKLCKDEFQQLLRPLREVAIMSDALLPGDASPTAVEAALELEEELGQAMNDELEFDDFYDNREEELEADPDMVLQLQEFDLKEAKKAQQRGRKKARRVAANEKRYRAEKRKVQASTSQTKIQSGISGRPISRVVLVGGATRMPAIGRLLAAVTGVVPQRTVNPDEAVALGCAVQVGVLDGNDELGSLTVLTPMQAALARALADQQGLLTDDPDFADF